MAPEFLAAIDMDMWCGQIDYFAEGIGLYMGRQVNLVGAYLIFYVENFYTSGHLY